MRKLQIIVYLKSIFFITILLLCLTAHSFSQQFICDFELIGGMNLNPLENNDQARQMLNDVMIAADVVPSTISIQAAKVPEAKACEDKDTRRRYILFNPAWIDQIGKKSGTDWATMAVLAHEIGHHKESHLIQRQDFCAPLLEAEADVSAGETLAKLKASLEEAESAYESIIKKATGDCYPTKEVRLKAVKKGWERTRALELMRFYERKAGSAGKYSDESDLNRITYYADIIIRYEEIDSRFFDPSAYLSRGRAYAALKRFEDGINDLTAYLSRTGDSADVYLALGDYNSIIQRKPQALKSYNKAINLNPLLFRAFKGRADIYYAGNKFPKALQDYDKALGINPDFGEAYIMRGNLYFDQQNMDAAFADYKQAIQLEPGNADFYIARAIAFTKRANFDSALVDYNKAVEVDPTPENYSKRAKFYLDQGQIQLAEEDKKSAAKLKHGKDVQRCDKLIDAQPTVSIYIARGDLFTEQREFEKAEADYTHAIELDRKSDKAYSSRAKMFKKKGDLDAALNDYTKAIGLNAEDASYFWARAEIYTELNKTDLAANDKKTAREINEREP